MKYKHSRIVFSLCGLNLSRIVSSLALEGIKLYNVKKDGRKLSFEVDLQDEKVVKDYFYECSIDYVVERIKGEKRLFQGIAQRPFLGIFAVLFIALFVFFENIVFKVELNGVSKVDTEQIAAILNEYSVNKPILKSRIDTKKLNEEIMEIEGVALSSVYIRGTVLYVEINEELDKGIMDKEEHLPIVADCDCIITSIYVERGTPMVEVGQTVKKGDVLIAAYLELDKESGQVLPCSPKGEVKGRVFYEESLEYYPRQMISFRTGKKEVDRIVSILDKEVLKEFDSELVLYEEERNYFKLYPLGIDLCTITRYELERKEVIIPFELVKEEKIEEIYGKLDKYIKNNVVINNKWCIIRDNGESVTIKAYLETEEKVH